MRKIQILFVVLFLASCASAPKKVVFFDNPIPFDQSEIAWAKEKGKTKVYGSSYIVDNLGLNGTTHTCVGYTAWLLPNSGYNRAYLTYLFGNLNESFWNHKGSVPFKEQRTLEGDNKCYYLESKCDVEGNFAFLDVPDGTFYLVTTAYYVGGPFRTFPPDYKGGMFLKKIVVSGQDEIRAVLTL